MQAIEEGDILNTISLYKKLFNKNKLDNINLEIKDFQQPLLVVALKTDDILESILKALYLVGYQAHLIEFKKALEYRKIASAPIINEKIKTLELIGAIQVNNYYIKLTAQGVSYFKDKYYRPNIKVLEKTKLENYTKAKMKLINLDKNIKATKVANNIYKGFSNQYAIVSDSKDTKETFFKKFEKVIKELQEDLLDIGARRLLKSQNQNTVINIEISISSDIYNKYYKELEELKKNRFISYDYRADLYNRKVLFNIVFSRI